MNDEDIRDRRRRDMLEAWNRQADPDDALTEATLERALARIRESEQDPGECLALNPTHVLVVGERLHSHYSKARRGKSAVLSALAAYGVATATFPSGLNGRTIDWLWTDDFCFFERRTEGWRPVCTKRARKLRKRGEDVRWLPEYDSNAWIPPHLRQEH